MCELFAMSSRAPSTLNYSLHEFARHGGLTHRNKSGWGIAYLDDRDVFLVKEAEPASDSPLIKFIAEHDRKSRCAIARVRLANVGTPTLRNTHPFRRVLGRRVHVFAHNGTFAGLHDDCDGRALRHEPVGETDSELAFCLLLERLRPLRSGKDGEPPAAADRLTVFAEFAADMRERGSANMLYSDGDVLFTHAHKHKYEEKDGFSEARAPGLSIRNCAACQQGPEYVREGLKIHLTAPHATLLASVPLDDHGWEPLSEGTALAVSGGTEVARMAT